MSKHFFVFVSLVLFSLFSNAAGRFNYSCKNNEGSIILTQTYLVVLQSKNRGEAPDMIVGNNISLNTLSRVYSDVTIQNLGYVKNIKMVEDKGVVSQNLGSKCEQGVDAGSQTKAYTIEARVVLSGKMDAIVQLECLETSYWDSTCNYNN